MHYFKFNISAWALSTAHLTLEEEAIYLRLVNHYYDSEKPIPLETQPVIRRLRLGSSAALVLDILQEYFTQTESGFVHSRCEEVLKEYRKTAKKNKANGAKGGRPKQVAASSISQEKPSGLPVASQVEPKHNPNYELRTKNYELVTKNEELVTNKPIKQSAPIVAVDFSVFNLSDSDLTEVKRIRMANKGGAIKTQRVANGLAKEINLALSTGITMDNLLTEWETRKWKSFKAEWMQSGKGFGNAGKSLENKTAVNEWATGGNQEKLIQGEVIQNGQL